MAPVSELKHSPLPMAEVQTGNLACRAGAPGRWLRLSPLTWCGIWAVVLLGAFAKPLWLLARFAAASDLYSHILLVPLIAAYLVWLKRGELLRLQACRYWPALLAALPGIGGLATYGTIAYSGHRLSSEDYLALHVSSLICLLAGGMGFLLGKEYLRRLAFSVALLVFMIPFPGFALTAIETFLQHASAEAANALILLSGTPFTREGLQFHFANITIVVARECTGIHSSLVLLVTSMLAGHLFLRSPWRKAFFVFFILPLGILRNGFRIFTISMLCAHVDSNMINSSLHRKGGPIFFVLSLAPAALVLLWLRRTELKRIGKNSGVSAQSAGDCTP